MNHFARQFAGTFSRYINAWQSNKKALSQNNMNQQQQQQQLQQILQQKGQNEEDIYDIQNQLNYQQSQIYNNDLQQFQFSKQFTNIDCIQIQNINEIIQQQNNKNAMNTIEIDQNSSALQEIYQKQEEKLLKNSMIQNKIENRIASMQYPANNPIEDSISFKQLKAIDGFTLAVYDGHGGWQFSQYVSENMCSELEKSLERNKMEFDNNEDFIVSSIIEAFDNIEEQVLQMAKKELKSGKVSHRGSCALFALIHENKLYAANLGDSKGVICSENKEQDTFKYQCKKINHKLNANSKKEQMRLKAAFQHDPDIVVEGYLKNMLQPTRAFGDFQLKYEEFNDKNQIKSFNGPYLTHKPDIQIFDLQKNDKYLILASDGLWDDINIKEVEKIVEQSNHDKNIIIENLFNKVFTKTASQNKKTQEQLRAIPQGHRRRFHDDISIIVADLQNQFLCKTI